MKVLSVEERLSKPNPDTPGQGNALRPYYPALDGLRAFSVVLVITAHTRGPAGFLGLFPGWLGVDIFFLLSGFLITLLLLKEEEVRGKVDLAAFYLRRIFRILPIYLAVLLIYVLLNKHRGGESWAAMKAGLPFYLTLLNEYSGVPVFGFTWTLGVEEKFYMMWPLLGFVWFSRRRRSVALILYLMLAASAPLSYQIARSYSGLMLGCLLAVVVHHPATYRLRTLLDRVSMSWLVPAGAVAAYACSRTIEAVFLFDLVTVVLVAHLITCRSWLGTALANRWFVWVGKRSYSMYLLHGLTLGLIESNFMPATFPGHLAAALVGNVMTAIAAHVAYLTIETPARNFGRHFIACLQAGQLAEGA